MFLSNEDGMSENFLSCIKGFKYHFEFTREHGISLEMLQQERASSRDVGCRDQLPGVEHTQGIQGVEVRGDLVSLPSGQRRNFTSTSMPPPTPAYSPGCQSGGCLFSPPAGSSERQSPLALWSPPSHQEA